MTPLTSAQLNEFVEAVTSSFDTEYLRVLDAAKRNSLGDKFLALFHGTNLYGFFTPVRLLKLTETVFEDADMRDIVLAMAERVSILTSSSDYVDSNNEKLFVDTFASAFCRCKFLGPDSLVPKQIAESISVDKETMERLLKANFWLLVVYLLLMFFNRTQVYIQTILAQKKG